RVPSAKQGMFSISSLITWHWSLFLRARAGRLLPRLPFGLAEAAGLERLYHTQGLFGRAPDVQVVHDRVAQNAFRVDHEQPAQGDALILDQHAVGARDFARLI